MMLAEYPAREGAIGALARLDSDFVNPPSLSQLAEAAQMSAFQLSRSFAIVHGFSIPSYIRRLRVEEAERLLKSTQLAVGEVATAVGYRSIAAFCRAYLREKGRQPGRSRREWRA